MMMIVRTFPAIGENYFCESGSKTKEQNFAKLFTDDPLWDGDVDG